MKKMSIEIEQILKEKDYILTSYDMKELNLYPLYGGIVYNDLKEVVASVGSFVIVNHTFYKLYSEDFFNFEFRKILCLDLTPKKHFQHYLIFNDSIYKTFKRSDNEIVLDFKTYDSVNKNDRFEYMFGVVFDEKINEFFVGFFSENELNKYKLYFGVEIPCLIYDKYKN